MQKSKKSIVRDGNNTESFTIFFKYCTRPPAIHTDGASAFSRCSARIEYASDRDRKKDVQRVSANIATQNDARRADDSKTHGFPSEEEHGPWNDAPSGLHSISTFLGASVWKPSSGSFDSCDDSAVCQTNEIMDCAHAGK
ncbi:unnamed protein product [Caenorhabditis sp. 36 PRJEB53466]|nr:unnamed protein product [Caenorhabditis sp. 36 PRJEB53466]